MAGQHRDDDPHGGGKLPGDQWHPPADAGTDPDSASPPGKGAHRKDDGEDEEK
ncbi:hypothetical protein [Streptomyces hainanensis]|uniref:hypothetical protein n=1 Tax=Streptomyces hainanensis TaxID=402648 RepID=UPI001404C233|nr:hypothetical protein [Streptomyces hainanensis]